MAETRVRKIQKQRSRDLRYRPQRPTKGRADSSGGYEPIALLLIAAGVPLPYIQAQLGHHSSKVTVDTYGHLVPGSHHKLNEKIQ